MLKETEMLIIHPTMAICSKCLEKATKGVWLQRRLILTAEGGVEEE